MLYYVIPARKGSKGFRYKNRKLLEYTVKSLPKKVHARVVVTTDDDEIIERLEDSKIKVLKRDPELSTDDAAMKDVLINVAEQFSFEDDDDFALCYLTYPERTYEEIRSALRWYRDRNAKSLLCRKKVKTHPYLCMFDMEDGYGRQVVDHELYRRQDYPEVFEISHYIAIHRVGEIPNLNPNLYNDETLFYKLNKDPIDVDHEEDYELFKNRLQ